MLHIFCALPCEAEPIIKHFKLIKSEEHKLFKLYLSSDEQISLIISGVGKSNASSAVTYHHASLDTSASDIWINIGIAGHGSLPVGEACLAHKITDDTNGSYWYPQIVFEPPCQTQSLITLHEPSTDYQDELFDMEASGFYSTAMTLGTAELIHSLKIVSDNPGQSTENISKAMVKDLIFAKLDAIEGVLSQLQSLSDELTQVQAKPEEYEAIINKWYFTLSRDLQLSRSLHQWQARFPDEEVMPVISELKTAKDVLAKIQNTLSKTEFNIHD